MSSGAAVSDRRPHEHCLRPPGAQPAAEGTALIDPVAEQWRLKGAERERLQTVFLHAYGQLAALEQLFIAV